MRRASAAHGGQATVELALCLPVLFLLVSALIQIAIIASDQIRVWHAAREAVRIAAVQGDEALIRETAERGGLRPLSVYVSPQEDLRVQGDPVTVRIAFSGGERLPLVGRLAADELEAAATMRIENP